MICPSCNAYVDDSTTVCPHCNAYIQSGDTTKKSGTSKGLIAGCSACGCGCLVIVLLIFGLIFYGVTKIKGMLEEQLQDQPLEVAEVFLSEDEEQQLNEKLNQFDTIQQGESMTLSLSSNELNYMIQSLLKDNQEVQNNFRGSIELNGSTIKTDFSVRANLIPYLNFASDKFLNGSGEFFLKIEDRQVIDFSMSSLTIGFFNLSEDVLNEINRQSAEFQNSLDEMNNNKTDEFHFAIDDFSVEEGIATIKLTAN